MHSLTAERDPGGRVVALSDKWRPVVPENGVIGNFETNLPTTRLFGNYAGVTGNSSFRFTIRPSA
jgi:hypothetical protein